MAVMTKRAVAMVDATLMNKKEQLNVMWEQHSAVSAKISTLKIQQEEVLQSIASLTCPYNIGTVLVAQTGIGVNGLVVESVLPPKAPSLTNRWAVQTFAYSKAGELTKRGVWLEEESAGEIVVKE